jgi:3'-phosphoadenosine 5'-phosphosulfate sulfotransferase (PAPS reductase)/FAD synthetase
MNTLKHKLEYTEDIIRCWVESWGIDGVYVAFSGGMDSTVLIHTARRICPDIKGVFSNTGLEFPEIVTFVKTFDNIDVIHPRIPFHKVIDKYGWPIISKEVSMAISRYRNTKREDQRQYRLYGRTVDGKKQTAGTIPKKYHHLVIGDSPAPFKIGEQCCRCLKKEPFRRYEKLTGRRPMIGVMAEDSTIRRRDAKRRLCNVYDAKAPQSRPLLHWTKADILEYTKMFNVPQCSIYNLGYDRTGCMFCMYGLSQERNNTGENRYQKMARTHPKLHRYCLDVLGAREVLKYLNIPFE